MAAVDTAKAIQNLLSEHGIDNDSLNVFIKEAENLPDYDVLNEFNKYVEDYQRANGYDSIMSAGEQLLDFFNRHSQELAYKASEMDDLSNTLEDYKQINDLYEQLDADMEDGDFN